MTVRCVATMEPAPAISWKIHGKDSGFSDDVSLSKDNSTLTISDPGVDDSGLYTCTASNNVGRDSKSSNINILRKLPKLRFYMFLVNAFFPLVFHLFGKMYILDTKRGAVPQKYRS